MRYPLTTLAVLLTLSACTGDDPVAVTTSVAETPAPTPPTTSTTTALATTEPKPTAPATTDGPTTAPPTTTAQITDDERLASERVIEFYSGLRRCYTSEGCDFDALIAEYVVADASAIDGWRAALEESKALGEVDVNIEAVTQSDLTVTISGDQPGLVAITTYCETDPTVRLDADTRNTVYDTVDHSLVEVISVLDPATNTWRISDSSRETVESCE